MIYNCDFFRTIFVHGFAVDEDGRKMSKSVGNVINPQDIMYGGADPKKQPTYGVDTLRYKIIYLQMYSLIVIKDA